MTYDETLAYLYEQLPMFSRIGAAAYKEDLDNTIALCNAIGNPQLKFKSIHIAGTNGKGSTSHILAAILQKAGYKTGLYTSPHIKHFGERIRINGVMISEQFVIDFTERTKAITETIQPSFFELTVAMAFAYFAEQEVDIAVIETGLGGRLDSTNIIKPEVSVITNIGFDHMNLLGNTLDKIAFEKAGIIKKDTPVVIGEVLPETLLVFTQKAQEENAPITIVSQEYEARYIDSVAGSLDCEIEHKQTGETEKITLDLPGLYQLKNAATVLATVTELRKKGYTIPQSALQDAFAHAKSLTGLKGRWDIIANHPTVICDVAHNADGMKQILTQLEEQYPTAALHFVLGFVNDKDIQKVLAMFPKKASYYFTNAHMPRALPHIELQQLAAEQQLKGNGYDDVNDAVAAAKKNAAANDVVMVCGSFFIIGEINEV